MAEKIAQTSELDKDDLLARALEDFSDIEQAESENRQTAVADIEFARLGVQWNPEDVKNRELQGRPCLTVNKLPSFIRQVVNDARQNKPSIKVMAADSNADPATAQVMGGLIRNIEYMSNADTAYDTATECAVSGGFGYVRVGIKDSYDGSDDKDICIERVSNPFSVYGDPASTSADGDDWNVAFVTQRMPKEQFVRAYPKAEMVDFDDSAWIHAGDSWFADGAVTVAEYWRREDGEEMVYPMSDGQRYDEATFNSELVQFQIELGVIQPSGPPKKVKTKIVMQHIMTGAEILKSTRWRGKYIPIVPVYGEEIDVQGKRYFRSLVHNAIDAQRYFNYMRSSSAEIIALTPKVPYIGPKGAFDEDTDRWNSVNTVSHPYLEYKGNIPPQRQPLDNGPAIGAISEASNASDDIKATIGMYDASLGARSNETSGRAIMARQREGDVATFHFLDNMARAIRQLGRILIDLIPKVYSTDRMIRVLGEDGEQQEVKIGTQALYKEEPVIDPNTGQPAVDPMTGQPQMQQVLDDQGEAILDVHNLCLGQYDLVVKTGPSFTSRREEFVQFATEAVRADPSSAAIIMPEVWKQMDFAGADKIAKKFEQMEQGVIPPQAQEKMEEMGKQLEQVGGELAQTKEENQKLQMSQEAQIAKIEADKALQEQKLINEKALQEQKMANELELARQKAQLDYDLQVEKINADLALAKAKAGMELTQKREAMEADQGLEYDKMAVEGERVEGAKAEKSAEKNEMKEMMSTMIKALTAPVEFIKDPKTGKNSGARRVMN